MINKKHILLLLIILLSTITLVSATDNQTTTQINTIEETTQDTQTISDNNQINTEKNTKTATNHYITNDNIDQYFDDDGQINTDIVKDHQTLTINDTIKNRDFFLTDVEITLTSINNKQLKNTTIYVENENIKIKNITINNQNIQTAIDIRAANTTVENCKIFTNSTSDAYGIYLVASNSTIKNNIINVTGPSDEINWETDVARTLALTVIGSNNKITDNTIGVYANVEKHDYGTVEAVSIQGDYSGNIAENNTLKNNKIYAEGINYAYGVNVGQSIDGNQIINNSIYTEANDFADSLQIFSTVSNAKIINNTITSKSNNLSDGIVISKDNMQGKTENNTISGNKITVTGDTSNLIEIYRSKNTTITDNNITATANSTSGIVITGKDAVIKNNNITITSKNNDSMAVSAQSSQNINITDNNVKTNSVYSVDITNTSTSKVCDNVLNGIYKGDKSVKTSSSTNIVENNTDKIYITTKTVINDVYGYINNTRLLEANVIAENNDIINQGYVIFKVNNQTLKDANNNVIKAYVNNSYAKLNYTIPKSWNKENMTIQAVYSGSGNYTSSRSNTAKIDVDKRTARVIAVSTFKNITGGRTMQLYAVVTDALSNYKVITGGVVIFKINGQTIRDENNNPIKGNVTNGIGFIDYNVPYGLSSKNYTITAVYSNSIYERAEGNTSLFVNKAQANINITAKITTSKNKTQIYATIYEANYKLVKGNTQVAIKINDRTVLKTTAINGTINVTIDTNYKSRQYQLKIVAGENNRYLAATKTAILEKVDS